MTKVVGNHKESKILSDVLGLEIRFSRTFYFPHEVTKYFENLNSIWIHDSGLREITKNDLKEYKNLRVLKLESGNLKVLEKNLFNFTPNLEVVDLMNNLIFFIDTKVFGSLNHLTNLDLRMNGCKEDFNYAGSKEAVKEITNKIENGICENQKALEIFEEFQCATRENFYVYDSMKKNFDNLNEVFEGESQKIFIAISIFCVILIILMISLIILVICKFNNLKDENNNGRKYNKRSFSNDGYSGREHYPTSNIYDEVN